MSRVGVSGGWGAISAGGILLSLTIKGVTAGTGLAIDWELLAILLSGWAAVWAAAEIGASEAVKTATVKQVQRY
jgi:hypothetical protein